MSIFAERLKKLRESKGYSQKELGSLSGVDASLISRYEQGERTPTIDNLTSLAKALGTTTDYLLGLTNNPLSCSEKINDEIEHKLLEYEKLKSKLEKLKKILEEE